MTTKDRTMKWVVLCFIAVSLLVLGSIAVEYNIFDIMYFICLIIYFIRYIYIKVKE